MAILPFNIPINFEIETLGELIPTNEYDPPEHSVLQPRNSSIHKAFLYLDPPIPLVHPLISEADILEPKQYGIHIYKQRG